MTARPGTRAAVAAAVAGGVAIASAFATAHVVRRAALRASHQQPTPEVLFEAATPQSPALRTAGRKLFLHNCAHCHGADARGDEGPDLHLVAASDRYIANLVRRGLPHEMPAFGKKFSAGDVAALLAYIRSLEQTGAQSGRSPVRDQNRKGTSAFVLSRYGG